MIRVNAFGGTSYLNAQFHLSNQSLKVITASKPKDLYLKGS